MNWKKDKVDILYDYTINKYPFTRTDKSRTDDLVHQYNLSDSDVLDVKDNFHKLGLITEGAYGGKDLGCLKSYQSKISEADAKKIINKYFKSKSNKDFKDYFIDSYNNKDYIDKPKTSQKSQSRKSSNQEIINNQDLDSSYNNSDLDIEYEGFNRSLGLSISIGLITILAYALFKYKIILLLTVLFILSSIGCIMALKQKGYPINPLIIFNPVNDPQFNNEKLSTSLIKCAGVFIAGMVVLTGLSYLHLSEGAQINCIKLIMIVISILFSKILLGNRAADSKAIPRIVITLGIWVVVILLLINVF